MIGAMPPAPAMTFSTRTRRAPVARSTMTARPTTMAQPPEKPRTKRAAIITPRVGVTAQATDASAMTRTAASSGRRRLRWSDTGPPTSCRGARRRRSGQGQLGLGRRPAQVVGHPRERTHVHVGGQGRDGGQDHDRRHQGGGQVGLDVVVLRRGVRLFAEVLTVWAVAEVRCGCRRVLGPECGRTWKVSACSWS